MRVGLVGTGFGTRVQMPGFSQVPGIEVVAVCSAQRQRAEAAASQWHIPFATDDYHALIAHPDVELVSVCTPPESHAEISVAALRGGKHVLCEKPTALTAEQAGAMTAAAVQAGRVNAINHEMRYTPIRRHLRDLVQSGFLGELRFVNASVIVGHGADPAMEPYYWTWVADRSRSGGYLNGMLSHHIDLLRFTFGEIEDVRGMTAILIKDKPVLAWEYRDGDHLGPDVETVGTRPATADDTAVFHGRIGGAPFAMTGTWAVHGGSGVRLEAYGTEGTLVLDAAGRVLGARVGEPLAEIPAPAALAVPYSGPGMVPLFAALAADLAGAVDRGEPGLFARFADGLAVQEVIDAVLR